MRYSKDTFLQLSDRYYYGVYLAKNLDVQTAGTPHDYGILAQSITGDYLEMGTFFGASAIIVGKTMQRFGIQGNITCIDPFIHDRPRSLQPSYDLAMNNLERHNIDADVWPKPSNSFSNLIYDTVFIDGDHTRALQDYHIVKGSPTIIFHDYCPSFPDVVSAVSKAVIDGYTPIHVSSKMAVLRNIG